MLCCNGNETVPKFLFFLNPHYWGNYTGEFRDHILKTHDTMGHNAQTCVNKISAGSHLNYFIYIYTKNKTLFSFNKTPFEKYFEFYIAVVV